MARSLARWFCGLATPPAPEKCPGGIEVPGRLLRRPDPAIYTQRQHDGDPDGPRWENPDIRVVDGATFLPIRSLFGLGAGRPLVIEARVSNLSGDAAAHNTRVDVLAAPFGIGGTAGALPLVSQTFVHVFPGSSQTVSAPFTTTAASAAFVVRLSHPDDANGGNNEGVHVCRVDRRPPGDTGSPIFPLWNPVENMRFIEVTIEEEGPESWFPSDVVRIGRSDQLLPVGVLPNQTHVIDGHLAGLGLVVPAAAAPGTVHVAHLTARALPELGGPRTLIGGVTYVVEVI